MLAYQWHAGSGVPVVFLHGLLGSQQDWQAVISLLPKGSPIRPLTLDLPFHGKSQSITCDSFADTRALLAETLNSLIPEQPFYLVGYSLGGRIALDFCLNSENPFLLGAFLEGVNLGLTAEAEREARWLNDQQWAHRFYTEPLKQVLEDWYQQPVFADLTTQQRKALILKREHNQGKNIAQMLLATSLAKQSDYSSAVQGRAQFCFAIGERDKKFRQLAEQHDLSFSLINNAGHNAHRENPAQFLAELQKFIQI